MDENVSQRPDEIATAVELMRSRFEAFRRADTQWLLATWHPSTRPTELDLTDNPRWRGLQIVQTLAGEADDHQGVVEFRATYLRDDKGVEVLHERSRFVREQGQWFYVDGDVQTP